MKNNNFQKKLLAEIERNLRVKITDSQIPPQGMDSRVFFAIDSNGKEYAIKSGKNAAGDIAAYNLIKKNKISIPTPKLYGNFDFGDGKVLILEKINFPLLESVSADRMRRYIPSMVENLREIHRIKSDKAGPLSGITQKSWKEVLLSKFTGIGPSLAWKDVSSRKCLDGELVLRSVKNIIAEIEKTKFINKPCSFLHTDFNQRNLFVNPGSNEIAGIIDWSEAVFGDPIYDFARVRMLIWHFNLGSAVLENYYKLVSFTARQKQLEKLYFLSMITEYLAYYSENLNEFNSGRIKLHQDFLRGYGWKN